MGSIIGISSSFITTSGSMHLHLEQNLSSIFFIIHCSTASFSHINCHFPYKLYSLLYVELADSILLFTSKTCCLCLFLYFWLPMFRVYFTFTTIQVSSLCYSFHISWLFFRNEGILKTRKSLSLVMLYFMRMFFCSIRVYDTR